MVLQERLEASTDSRHRATPVLTLICVPNWGILTDLPRPCCFAVTIRSALSMAEALMKKYFGRRVYVQSAGVKNDMEIDGFSVAVCKELGVELDRHRSRSFEEMQDGRRSGPVRPDRGLVGEVRRAALDLDGNYHLEVEYWPIPTQPPSAKRARPLSAYRQARPDPRPHPDRWPNGSRLTQRPQASFRPAMNSMKARKAVM